jgi:hypothetical protein
LFSGAVGSVDLDGLVLLCINDLTCRCTPVSLMFSDKVCLVRPSNESKYVVGLVSVSLVLGDLLGYLSLSLGDLHSHKRMGPTEVRAVRDLSHEWDWSVRLSVRTVVSSNTVVVSRQFVQVTTPLWHWLCHW